MFCICRNKCLAFEEINVFPSNRVPLNHKWMVLPHWSKSFSSNAIQLFNFFKFKFLDQLKYFIKWSKTLLSWGKGSSGTSWPRNLHNGSQPSCTSHTRSLFRGTLDWKNLDTLEQNDSKISLEHSNYAFDISVSTYFHSVSKRDALNCY